jgi:hypothetical protein
MRFNIARRKSAPIQTQYRIIKTIKPPLMLLDNNRLKF